MNWAAVDVERADVVTGTANAIMEILSAVKREQAPDDFEAWDKRPGLGYHMYYPLFTSFSPNRADQSSI